MVDIIMVLLSRVTILVWQSLFIFGDNILLHVILGKTSYSGETSTPMFSIFCDKLLSCISVFCFTGSREQKDYCV